MCKAVQCRICGKLGWTGCGEHLDEVFAGVPVDQRCPGHDDHPAGRGFRRLFGRF